MYGWWWKDKSLLSWAPEISNSIFNQLHSNRTKQRLNPLKQTSKQNPTETPIPNPSPSKVKIKTTTKHTNKPTAKQKQTRPKPPKPNQKHRTSKQNKTLKNLTNNKKKPQNHPTKQLMHHKFRSLVVFSLKWYRYKAGVKGSAENLSLVCWRTEDFMLLFQVTTCTLKSSMFSPQGNLLDNLSFSPLGQPYNQLAILASSKGDHLTTIFYYCRSIAVKFPFPAASTNLQKALSKALERWDYE